MSDVRFEITGNIANDVQLRVTPSGKSVVNFRVLSTARVSDGNSGWTDGETTAVDVTAWDKLAEHIDKRLRKGHHVTVGASRIKAEPWSDKENKPRATLKVIADKVALSLRYDQTTEAYAQQ